MISSGRSFIQGASLLSGCEFVSEALEAAAHAAVGAVRPDLQDDPADEARVDACASPRPCGRRPSRSAATIDFASASESSYDGGELDGQPVLRLGDERVELRADLRQLAGAALLGDEPDEVAHELVAVGGELRRARRPCLPGRSAGCAGTRAARAPRPSRPRARRGRPRPRPRGRRPARPRRARGRTCGARRPLGAVLLQRGEVELGDRLVDEPPLILGVEHLAGHTRGRLEREVGDLGADEVERALRLGVDLPLRLLEPARALRLGLRPSRARSARPPTLRASARMPAASPFASAMSCRCCSRSSRASSRALSASSTAARIRSRRSSIVFWIGPNANFRSTKNVIAKQISVQIISPGTTSIRPPDDSLP